MSNWEYKVITSGKGGFASPALLEKFLNDLGQEGWEIITFHTQPDNLLAFTGLVRRPTQRDWTLEDAAAAAARAEADKLRAEFEAKFKAASSNAPAQAAEDAADVFLAEEKVGTDDGLRRLRDTSRDDDRDAPEEEGVEREDDWDKLAEEDELPTFFDAMRPHMRKNQRGPGMSVGLDYLAKKWRLEEADLKSALVECGLQIPADENAKPVYVEFEGDLYWVNINRRGEIWINTREKPEPVFRIVPGKRLSEEEAPADTTAPREERRQQETRAERHAESPAQPARESQENRSPSAVPSQPAAPRTFLDKVRGLMRRNRRGHGWSGSFGFLTKALKTDEAGLLAQLAELGLKLKDDGAEKPLFHEEGDFLYWMDKNQRGEIWINARKNRGGQKSDGAEGPETGGEEPAESGAPESLAPDAAVASIAPTSEPGVTETAPAAPAAESTVSAPAPVAETAPTMTPERVRADALEALRLLLQPKKRGEGFTAKIDDLATQLGRPAIEILEALVAAGLNVPDDAKTKPTFGERNGEIFWLNRNAKGDLWLNAKDSKARRARSRKKEDGDAETDDGSGSDTE